MKDSFDAGLRMLSDMARHPAFAQAEIDRQRQQLLSSLQVSFDDPGVHRQRRVRSPGVRLSSVRPAADRHARHDRAPDHARRSGRVSPEVLRAEQRDPGHRRRRDRRGSVRGGRRRCSATGSGATCRPTRSSSRPTPTRRVVIVNKPDSVQTEVRVGQHRDPAQPSGLHGREPGHPHSRRRGQQPPASGAAHGARPDLQRAGELRHVQGQRRLRSRNQHAHGSDRRGAPAHRGRVLAAAARARERTRAVRREGVPDRQFSADDRNAGRDRAADAERDVLRSADRTAPDASASA